MTLEPSDVRRELAFDEQALGISGAEFDELLDSLITRESDRVEDAIDVGLGTETVAEATSRPSHVTETDLPLSNRPVQSVTGVTIDTDRVGGEDIGEDDYVVHETHLELLPSADRKRWPTKRRSVEVEYEHGYPDNDTPEPIFGAIIGLVRQTLQEIEADGIESESIDGDSVSYELADDVAIRHLRRAKRFDEPSYYGGAGVV